MARHSPAYVREKMAELMEPIDRQIMMTDDQEEILMFACTMLQRVRTILDSQIGPTGRKQILQDAIDKD